MANETIKIIKVRLNTGVIAETYYGIDDADNERLFCRNGASLEDWRNDSQLVPPWLLPRDFTDPDDYVKLMNAHKDE